MKTILSLALLCFAMNAHGATYLLLSETNNFAKGITNEAKAYTDAHSGGGAIFGTLVNTNGPTTNGVVMVASGTSGTNMIPTAVTILGGSNLHTGPVTLTLNADAEMLSIAGNSGSGTSALDYFSNGEMEFTTVDQAATGQFYNRFTVDIQGGTDFGGGLRSFFDVSTSMINVITSKKNFAIEGVNTFGVTDVGGTYDVIHGKQAGYGTRGDFSLYSGFGDLSAFAQSAGIYGSVSGQLNTGVGVIGVSSITTGSSIGVSGSAKPGATVTNTIGGYFEVGDQTSAASLTNAVIVADNTTSGVPLIIGRTNNGTQVFSVEASGAITSANTNRWTLGATNASGQVAVTVDAMPLHLLTAEGSADLSSLNVGTLYLSNMTANVVPVFDGNTNLVPSAASTNDLNAIAGKATVMGHYMGTDTNALLSALGGQPLLPTPSWTQITPDTTNAVVNLTNAVPGVDKNFYYSITTSNYIIFSNLVQGAQGTIWINASGTPQQMQFASTYDNFSTNDLTYVSGYVWSLTNRAIIAYKIGWGTDATNVMLAVKKK